MFVYKCNAVRWGDILHYGHSYLGSGGCFVGVVSKVFGRWLVLALILL